MILSSTTDKIEVVTSGTADIQYSTAYVIGDKTTSPMVVKDSDTKVGLINTASTTDVTGSPAGANDRWAITRLSFRNAHASSSNDLTVRYVKAAGTARELIKVTLLAGEELVCDKNGVWFVYATDGSVKAGAGPGRFLRETLLTAGTTFTTGADCSKIRVRLVGGGGGGGGCTSVASAAAGAGGGGAGGYTEKVFNVSPSTAYTYAIGAAGTGASGAAGNNGGDTTFTVGATTITGKGGTGAPVGTAATTLVARAGGAGGVADTNGDVNAGGAPGAGGVVLIVATPIVLSGEGGSSQMGGGGLGLVAVGNGNNATGFGAGGGGAATGASVARTGGNGTAGAIIVEEYA